VAAMRKAINFAVVSQAVVFSAICPRCKREEVQDAFTVADLMRLLYGGYPRKRIAWFAMISGR
jgi:hypothetical protein